MEAFIDNPELIVYLGLIILGELVAFGGIVWGFALWYNRELEAGAAQGVDNAMLMDADRL